jgi:hypothetical protein
MKLRNGICVDYIERTSGGNTECFPSVCLHSLVIMVSDNPCERSSDKQLTENALPSQFWVYSDITGLPFARIYRSACKLSLAL